MIAEIVAGAQSLKAAKEIIQGLSALKTEAAVSEIKVQLNGLILDAQEGLFAAQQQEAAAAKRIEALEQEIVRMKDWAREAERYEAADAGNGAIAYRLKEGVETSEPEHWLCPTCFQERKKSYLQPETYMVGRTGVLKCGPCRTEILIAGLRQPRGN